MLNRFQPVELVQQVEKLLQQIVASEQALMPARPLRIAVECPHKPADGSHHTCMGSAIDVGPPVEDLKGFKSFLGPCAAKTTDLYRLSHYLAMCATLGPSQVAEGIACCRYYPWPQAVPFHLGNLLPLEYI